MQQRLSYTNQQQRKQAALALHYLPSPLLPQAKLLLVVWGTLLSNQMQATLFALFKSRNPITASTMGDLKVLLPSRHYCNQHLGVTGLLYINCCKNHQQRPTDPNYHISYKEMAKFICD